MLLNILSTATTRSETVVCCLLHWISFVLRMLYRWSIPLSLWVHSRERIYHSGTFHTNTPLARHVIQTHSCLVVTNEASVRDKLIRKVKESRDILIVIYRCWWVREVFIPRRYISHCYSLCYITIPSVHHCVVFISRRSFFLLVPNIFILHNIADDGWLSELKRCVRRMAFYGHTAGVV